MDRSKKLRFNLPILSFCTESMEHSDSQGKVENDDTSEELLAGSQEPSSDFDIVVGHLEEIMMSDDFQNVQDKFMNENYNEFEDTEENKLCYTEIHDRYIDTVERTLEKELRERIPNFSMRSFMDSLVPNSDHLDGEVFEMLYTFSDFLAFKEMMLDYKKAKTGETVNLELTNTYITCNPCITDPVIQLHNTSCNTVISYPHVTPYSNGEQVDCTNKD
ncbi:unnamed protein product [Heterobilharzia americana]|nr:unnamed protein product [Heterobilharzia americana]